VSEKSFKVQKRKKAHGSIPPTRAKDSRDPRIIEHILQGRRSTVIIAGQISPNTAIEKSR
jgi:hypothetical protein